MKQKKKEVPTVKSIVQSEVKAISKIPAFVHDLEAGKKDISINALVQYNLIFFIPTLLFMIFALKIGTVYADYFEASPWVVAKILMVPFMLIVFYFIIPFIRDREKIAGIRYSLLAFVIIGIGITLPSAIKGNYGFLFSLPLHFAGYMLMTFFFCPEVLGLERTIRDWFRHKKQISIITIYVCIVLLYLLGFGALNYEVYTDTANPQAFKFDTDKTPGFETFLYYSMVTFSTTGYGDITPVSASARLVFFIESLMGLVINVLFIVMLLVFISNAEFLSQRSAEAEIAKEVKQEEREIRQEEKQIKKELKEIEKVEKEVKEVEKEESFLSKAYRKLNEW